MVFRWPWPKKTTEKLCFNSYRKSLPEISRKKVTNDSRTWMWFEAPNKEALGRVITRMGGNCAKSTPIDEVPFDNSVRTVLMGDPWEAVSIKREKIVINNEKVVKCWLSDDVFFMSRIVDGYARFLQFTK
ncbi:MAG: hypothetical protein PHT40_03880 [Patescibacteria group bacterium]|nr:hypothetical protein [Patescibacteria group bacterium]